MAKTLTKREKQLISLHKSSVKEFCSLLDRFKKKARETKSIDRLEHVSDTLVTELKYFEKNIKNDIRKINKTLK